MDARNPKFVGIYTDLPSFLTMVLTILLGQVIFPGLCRVVIHSQYLSINGMMSCRNREHFCELLLADTITDVSPVPGSQTLSLENIVLGCSSCVLDCHVRLARALRHISLRSEKQNPPGLQLHLVGRSDSCVHRDHPKKLQSLPHSVLTQPSLNQLHHLHKLVAKYF